MNNRFVYGSRWRGSQSKHYQEYVPVNLKKGKNLLLVKVALSDRATAGARWNFNMFVGNGQYAQESFLKDYRFTILNEAVVKDSVRLYLGPFVNDEVSVKVEDMHSADVIPWMKPAKNSNRETQSGLGAIPLEGIDRECLYRISVGLRGDTLRQDFIFGDYANVVAGLKRKYQGAKEMHGLGPNEDFGTAYERLDYLGTKPNQSASRVSEKSHWDLSRILFAKEVWRHLDGYERSWDGRFSGIISVEEKAFRKGTYESNHLVVIGAKWKNAYLKRIVDGLPIKLERDSVVFREKKHGRKNLMVGFVYPNPLNPKKYVYFIETDKAAKDLFHRDFTNECPHDYELYNTGQNEPIAIEMGNFDNLWK